MESDERRRVAEALREMETPAWPTLTKAVMGHPSMREKVVERLAELVDPTADLMCETWVIESVYSCGSCGRLFGLSCLDVPDYCPGCGARIMKGEEDGDR